MSINFFKANCQESTNATRFGLYDAEDATPAKIKFNDEQSWNATVINDEPKDIIFTAIDNCIEIYRDSGDMDSRCDVMMRYDDNLLFVELKNKRDSWKSEGLSQIEATIKRMIEEDEQFYYSFKKRKAIVANAKHQFPCFQEYDSEQREYFKSKYKIRVQFEAEIIIK